MCIKVDYYRTSVRCSGKVCATAFIRESPYGRRTPLPFFFFPVRVSHCVRHPPFRLAYLFCNKLDKGYFSPVLVYSGIESHLLCKLREYFASVIDVLPISFRFSFLCDVGGGGDKVRYTSNDITHTNLATRHRGRSLQALLEESHRRAVIILLPFIRQK